MKASVKTRPRAPAVGGIWINLPVGNVQTVLRELGERLISASAEVAAQVPKKRVSRISRGFETAVEAFVAETCLRTYGRERARDLAAAYGVWSAGAGAPAVSGKVLGQVLASLGYTRCRSSVIFYCGLRLRGDIFPAILRTLPDSGRVQGRTPPEEK